jgi:ArsR family transcriptional regulator, arsenate/arsenite/antimonite-responsive transcriptional repressor
MRYAGDMALRNRPSDCCPTVRAAAELAGPTRERLVAIYRALGDANRFEIFRLIAAQDGPICVCDIVARFELTQPTISYHLKLLRQAGLVTVSQRGVWAYYAVDPEGVRLLQDTTLFNPGRVGVLA